MILLLFGTGTFETGTGYLNFLPEIPKISILEIKKQKPLDRQVNFSNFDMGGRLEGWKVGRLEGWKVGRGV